MTAPTPTERDIAMMRRALDLARAAGATGEVPIGAVVYETATGRIVGEGANTREHANDPAGHAELIAIRAAAMTPPAPSGGNGGGDAEGGGGGGIGDWRLNDCTLVVTLEPCAMCAGLIVNARLGRLVYGAPDPKAGAAGSLFRLTEDARLNHRVTPIVGVLAEECGEVLREFFKARR